MSELWAGCEERRVSVAEDKREGIARQPPNMEEEIVGGSEKPEEHGGESY